MYYVFRDLGVFANRSDLDIVGGYSARGVTSSGTLSREAFCQIAQEFLDAVLGAGKLDAIYFTFDNY